MTQNISAVPPYGLRLPQPLKRTVKKAAKENGRSMNSEIIYQLGRVYGSTEAAGSEGPIKSPAASSNQRLGDRQGDERGQPRRQDPSGAVRVGRFASFHVPKRPPSARGLLNTNGSLTRAFSWVKA